MTAHVYIFLDEDFERPLYADPDPDEEDRSTWQALCEAVQEASEGDRPRTGHQLVGDRRIAWVHRAASGLAFVVTVPEAIAARALTTYLADLVERYHDEVDDLRGPDREGVHDVFIDVVAPWEDDEEG